VPPVLWQQLRIPDLDITEVDASQHLHVVVERMPRDSASLVENGLYVRNHFGVGLGTVLGLDVLVLNTKI